MTTHEETPTPEEVTYEETLAFCRRIEELLIDPSSLGAETDEYLQSMYDKGDARIRVARCRAEGEPYRGELELGTYEVSAHTASPLENGNVMVVTKTYRVEPYDPTATPVASFELNATEIDPETGESVLADAELRLKDAMREKRFDEVDELLATEHAVGVSSGRLTSELCAEALATLENLGPENLASV